VRIRAYPRPGGGTRADIAWQLRTRNGHPEQRALCGELVWNKLHYSKDPEDGARVSRVNPYETRLKRIPVPHLRIIDDALWQSVRRRQGELVSKETDVPIWIAGGRGPCFRV